MLIFLSQKSSANDTSTSNTLIEENKRLKEAVKHLEKCIHERELQLQESNKQNESLKVISQNMFM